MIISASRRTDIPAFYSKWFMNRLKEKFVLVRNPVNRKQISKIPLSPEFVECIVFWTKNPLPLLPELETIDQLGYKYYFQFTLTSYNKTIEPNVPKKTILIDSFKKLSYKIGKEKVIWRYDPILISDVFHYNYHLEWFHYMAEQLSGYTDKCIISFLDVYKKCERNMKEIALAKVSQKDRTSLAGELASISKSFGIVMASCAEDIDLSSIGISHGKCIDDSLISKINHRTIEIEKDKNQRDACGCVKSIDIGAYNCCKHNCVYCYANYSRNAVESNTVLHDPSSPLIYGCLQGDESISTKKIESFTQSQLPLF